MALQTITIHVRSNKAIQLLKDLEMKKLISIVDSEEDAPKSDLASRLLGCITKEEGDAMHEELRKMRDEWERGF